MLPPWPGEFPCPSLSSTATKRESMAVVTTRSVASSPLTSWGDAQPTVRPSDSDRRFFTRAQLQSNGIERIQRRFPHHLHRCEVRLVITVKIGYGKSRRKSARPARSPLRRFRRRSAKRHCEHTEAKQAQARPRHAGNIACCAKASNHERLLYRKLCRLSCIDCPRCAVT